jgi:hypothetical protein
MERIIRGRHAAKQRREAEQSARTGNQALRMLTLKSTHVFGKVETKLAEVGINQWINKYTSLYVNNRKTFFNTRTNRIGH